MCKHACIDLTYVNDDDEEITFSVPSKMAVCPNCEGGGYVLNESMRYHAYTSYDEEMQDPEFREEYFKRGGIYDVQCPTCKGKNVVPVPDERAIDSNPALKEQYDVYLDWKKRHDQLESEYEAECRMERMMGC